MDAKQATRRRFLKAGAALAGVAVGARSAHAHVPGSAAPTRLATHAMAFGERSRYVTVMRPMISNIGQNIFLHGEPEGLDAFTPLRDLVGNVTPSDLHYVSSHGSVPPDIDPGQHRLVISGLVKRPLVFTMDELVRLPSVSRPHYIECVVNRPTTEGKTVEQMLPGAGTEVGHHLPLRRAAAARPRLFHDRRSGMVRLRRRPQGGGIRRRRS